MLVSFKHFPIMFPITYVSIALKVFISFIHTFTHNYHRLGIFSNIMVYTPYISYISNPTFFKKLNVIHFVDNTLYIRRTNYYRCQPPRHIKTLSYSLHYNRVSNATTVKSIYLYIFSSFGNIFLYPFSVIPRLIYKFRFLVINIFYTLIRYNTIAVRNYNYLGYPIFNTMTRA